MHVTVSTKCRDLLAMGKITQMVPRDLLAMGKILYGYCIWYMYCYCQLYASDLSRRSMHGKMAGLLTVWALRSGDRSTEDMSVTSEFSTRTQIHIKVGTTY